MKRLAVLMVLWAAPALAQKLDCSAPVTQADMNQCAHIDWQFADEELNAAFADAVSMARMMAQYSDRDIEEELRAAQRAWITFRDLACEVESLQAEGGSMRPLLYSGCLARLTWARVNDLVIFADTGG